MKTAKIRKKLGNKEKNTTSCSSRTEETQKLIEKLVNPLNADAQIPSISELEKKVSVSRVTIISALNRLVSSGCIYAVHGKGYFKSGNTKLKKYIGFLINNMNFSDTPDHSNRVILPYLLGIQETLTSAVFKILPFSPQQLLSAYSLTDLCSYDGLVYIYSSYQDNSFMNRITVPFVVFGGPGAHKGIPVIRTDYLASVEACLAYFSARGHRRIAFICYEEYPHYENALQEMYRRYSLSVQKITAINQSHLSLDLSRINRFFDLDCGITAVLASDKQTADYFLNQCALRAVAVPDDFSFASISYPRGGNNIFNLRISGGDETEKLTAAGRRAGIVFSQFFSGKHTAGSVYMITTPFREGNSVKNI